MKLIIFIFLISSLIAILGINQIIYAQQGNLTKIINEKFVIGNLMPNAGTAFKDIPTVEVDYESPTAILISGDLITQNYNLTHTFERRWIC
jgi:hypothetical protein